MSSNTTQDPHATSALLTMPFVTCLTYKRQALRKHDLRNLLLHRLMTRFELNNYIQ